MIRLHIITEGYTEQRFVQHVLAPHLGERYLYLFPLYLHQQRQEGRNRVSRWLVQVSNG